MNFFQLAIFIALAGNLLFGGFVILAQKKRMANQGFFVLVIALAAWLLCLGFGATASSVTAVEFWIRQSTASSAFIPVALNLVRLTLVYRDETWGSLLHKFRWWLVPYPFIAGLCQTHFFLESAELPHAGNMVARPVYGPGIYVFAAYMTVMVVLLMARYIVDIRASTGIKRTELQFVLIACIIGFLSGVVTHFISNVTGVIEFGQLLPVPVILMDAVMAYGIATRNIIDTPAFLRRVLANLLLVLYLSIVYMIVLVAARYLLPPLVMHRYPADHLAAAIAIAMLVAPAHGLLHKFAGRIFASVSESDVMDLLRQSSRTLGSMATLDELVVQFTKLLNDLLGPETTYLLMIEQDQFVQRHPALSARERALVLNIDDPIVVSLNRTRRCLAADLLQRSRSDTLLQKAGSRMAGLGLKAAAGIWSKDGLQGLVLVGPRLNGRIYGAIEQQAIEGLCGQLAFALDNARLYTEVQNSRIYNDILLDRLASGVIAVNLARTVTVFNHEARRITGLEKSAVLGASIDVLPGPLREGIELAIEHGGNRDVDVALPGGKGRDIPVRYTCTTFHGHAGLPLGALMVLTDQTELKKLEYQLRRSDRLASLGTLSAGMAHEIKNPLVSLKTFSQLLPERYDDPDFRQTFSSLLGEEVARIDRIVNQLLRFARPAKPSLAPLALHGVVDNTLNLVKQQMRQRNINLLRQFRADSDRILGDGDMLAQAILNFLLNAIDAMEKEGQLTLRTEIIQHNTNQLDLWGRPVQTSKLRLSVIDNGRGISEDDLLHVFDPFFTTKANGTGLGLSVSYSIIQEHGGAIDIDSRLGQGTTLHLTFPLLDEEATV